MMAGLFFETERTARCTAAREFDLAFSAPDPDRRQRHLARAARALGKLVQPGEASLIVEPSQG